MKKLLLSLFLLLASITGFTECSMCHKPVIEEKMVDVGDCALFCHSIGGGSPIIVVHGGPGMSQDYLHPYVDDLARTRKHLVIFYDQRGCGKSTAPASDEAYNLHAFVEDLDKVRKAYGFEKVTILGHSWGGFVAMHYALTHPDNVEKLILSNTIPASSEEFALFREEWMKRTAPYQAELDALADRQSYDPLAWEQVLRIIFRTYCYNPSSADQLNLEMSEAACINGNKIHKLMGKNIFMKPYNLHMGLGLLSIPTLVIHGDAEPIPYQTAYHIHQSIPGSQFILMEKCGHFPYVEDYDAYMDHLRAFLK